MDKDRIAALKQLESFEIEHLMEIMAFLRSSSGCPWDKEQTHQSLKQCLIEEAYEVMEAIDLHDDNKLKDELGDLLLQIIFHAQIAKEMGKFDMDGIISGVCRKIISRHVHIFGEASADSADQALNNWEAVKKKEKGLTTHVQSMKDIPPHMPALMRSLKVQKKAAMVGFDWERLEDVMLKVEEELCELRQACLSTQHEEVAEEVGDLLFAVVNVSRFLKVQPEFALKSTIDKFITRFEYIEQQADKPLEQMTLSEMDALWNEAKTVFAGQNR